MFLTGFKQHNKKLGNQRFSSQIFMSKMTVLFIHSTILSRIYNKYDLYYTRLPISNKFENIEFVSGFTDFYIPRGGTFCHLYSLFRTINCIRTSSV